MELRHRWIRGCVVGVVMAGLSAACSSESPEQVGSSSEALCACSPPTDGNWSGFGSGQCVAGVWTFYNNRYGVKLPALGSYNANNRLNGCAQGGACRYWESIHPSPTQWNQYTWGTETPQTYDMVVFQPTSGNPAGHVASIDHMSGGTPVVMDSNTCDGYEVTSHCVHTYTGSAPYGFFRLKALDKPPCHADGTACTSAAQCCNSHFCNGAGTCAACLSPGDTCASDADCCGLSVCTTAKTCSDNPLPAETTGNRWITAVNAPSTGASQIFVRGADGTLANASETNGVWSALAPFGQHEPVACGSAASYWLKNASTRTAFAEVFSPGTNGARAVDTSYDPITKSWDAPIDFAGAGLGQLVSLPWSDGHLEVFALAQDGSVWHRPFSFTANDWENWSSIGGSFVSTPSAIIRGDGVAELFAIDAQGLLWHDESDANYPSGWTGWALLSTSTTEGDAGDASDASDATDASMLSPAPVVAARPMPVRLPDGHIELFATNGAGELLRSVRGTSTWGPFATIASGVVGEASPIVTNDAADVFVRSVSGDIVHTLPVMGTWQVASMKQQSNVEPYAWLHTDGTAEVFAAQTTTAGTSLVHISRGANGVWSSWSPIAGGIDTCVASAATDGGTNSTDSPSGSCNCDVTGAPRSSSGWFITIGALLVLGRRRRTS